MDKLQNFRRAAELNADRFNVRQAGINFGAAYMSFNGRRETAATPAVPQTAGPVISRYGKDKKNAALNRHQLYEREKTLPRGEIESLELTLYSTEEIDNQSVVTVSSSEEYGNNTVRDPRFGPKSDGEVCETCSQNLLKCPGHTGKIDLPEKFFHPLLINRIILILGSVCNSCGKLLITPKQMEDNGFNKLAGTNRLTAIRDFVARQKKICLGSPEAGPNVANCTANPIYASLKSGTKDEDSCCVLKYSYGGDSTVFLRNTEEAYKILDAIPDEDARLLGFVYSHPRNMILERLIVVPYCARPDLSQGGSGKLFLDDLTVMYRDTVGIINKYNNPSHTDAERQTIRNEIAFKITHLMKNTDDRYKQGGSKAYNCLTKRLQGKTGLIRGNVLGKRVDFVGRTVVGPAAYLRVDEIGFPRMMANKLSRPIVITELNRPELEAKMEQGKIHMITPREGNNAGVAMMIAHYRRIYKNDRLNLGDTVHRALEDGDIVLVNRQPTLHKNSIVALKIRIIDDLILRLNLSITTPLNADFDGDELNIHVPQTIESYVEAERLMSIAQNIMSGQTNAPVIGIVYDSLTEAYLMTIPQHKVDELTVEIAGLKQELNKHPLTNDFLRYEQELVNLRKELAQLRKNEQWELVQRTEDDINRVLDLIREIKTNPEVKATFSKLAKAEAELLIYKERSILPPHIFDLAIDQVSNKPDFVTLKDRLETYGIPWRSGRALASAAFPQEFFYDNKKVQIKEGVLISGYLSKDTLGSKDGSIIAEMVKQLGGEKTIDFMSDFQFIAREFGQAVGFSVGPEDCFFQDEEARKQIAELINQSSMKVMLLEKDRKHGDRVDNERTERKILEILENTTTAAGNINLKQIPPDNALAIMSRSQAKGSDMNTNLISNMLGQVSIKGKRPVANLHGTEKEKRLLPIHLPGTVNPEDNGFCIRSYAQGLPPGSYFIHAAGSRLGLIDTAVGTADTGHLAHQLLNALKDVAISPSGAVITHDDHIISPIYGDDGLDPSKITKVLINDTETTTFRKLEQLAFLVNNKIIA